MILGILKEQSGENRVSITPDAVSTLQKLGITRVMVEQGAGAGAFYSDESYTQAGAEIADHATVLKTANILTAVTNAAVIPSLRDGQLLIGQFNPLNNEALATSSRASKASIFSLDLAPRTTRAQALDVLSSMATVAGYKAVLLAANELPTFFPMFMTAAGTIKPAKVLILGAGVAGLQAISTARRLGAVVEAFDVRAAAREEVLSLGAKFVEVEGAVDDKAAGGYAVQQTEDYLKKQAQAIHDHALLANVVICTAQIPGKKAPVLLKKETVEAMKSGAVVIDLAASTGGNCELTENNKTTMHNGVKIIGESNLPSTAPKDASVMFGKNILNFLKLILIKNELQLNFEDDIVSATCVAHQGETISARLKS